jgi:hypothetical protein
VRAILEDLRGALNKQLEDAGGRRFSWQYLDEARVWGDSHPEIAGEMAELGAQPALVVVDPLSFYDLRVFSRYSNFVQPLFRDEHTFVLVLAPFALPRQAEAVRGAIESMATEIFKHYYSPPVFDHHRYARCGANVSDPTDFQGWLMSTIGPYVAPQREPEQPAVLRAAPR